MTDCKIIQGDCLEVMKTLEAESVDMILTDPPYMISKEAKIARSRNPLKRRMKYQGKDISMMFGDWDIFETEDQYWEFIYAALEQFKRILKTGGHMLMSFDKFKITPLVEWCRKNDFIARQSLYWVKCLSGDTTVIIKRGEIIRECALKELKNIWSDVLILTPRGFKRILGFREREDIVYEIKTVIGSIKATQNHRFPYWRAKNKIQLNTLKHILSLKHYPHLLFYNKGFDGEIKKISTPKITFDLNFDLGWIIGLFVAEGSYDKNTQIRFSLHKKEMSYYEKIKNYVERFKFYNSKMQPNGIKVYKFVKDNTLAVYFGSQTFKELIKKFVIGKGAKNKRLNTDLLLSTTKEFRKGFLKGIIDGDGYIWKKRNYCKLILSNYVLIKDIQLLAFSLGYMTSIRRGVATNQSNKKFEIAILTFRQPKRSKERGDDFLPVRIKNIECVGKEKVYDVAVAGSYFVCNRGVISHNSNPVPMARKVSFMNAHELIFWATKHTTSRTASTFHYELGQHPDYFIHCIPPKKSKSDGIRQHPCQKPVKLMEWLISYLSNENDTILDPFAGSGTTGVAALNLGRKYILIEKSPQYYNVIIQRIKFIQSQTNLNNI